MYHVNWINIQILFLYRNIDRDKLFGDCLSAINHGEDEPIFYIDDRMDNINAVLEKYPNIKYYHCKNMNNLFELKYDIC